ncbi:MULTISPECIES: hypothetical protein [Rufibacter]|uniref:Uncharacterized protein n=1 Tax=Rufibacter quisquiliarum TaxID=1549639 RepID=A0A839GX93_9BACT|nr:MULTISPECIES: hypothetical protein [Rufibacter]MBA9079467.1 hypothetical protein [Rufibacter quisquiliarum]
MNLKPVVWGAVLSLAAFTACDKTSELFEVEMPLAVSDTRNFPERPVRVDTTITLQALFTPENGCGRRSRIDTATVSRVFTMKLYVKYPEEGSDVVCTDVARPLYHTISFRPKETGKYEFRFWKSDTEYLTKTIEVVPIKK